MSRIPDLSGNTVLLTANNRLARLFTAEHNANQIAAGKTAWPSAPIMPLSAWLQKSWQDAADNWPDGNIPRLLNNVQETVLWERIVRAATLQNDGVTNPTALARLAQQAWQQQQAWRIRLPDGMLTTLDAQQYAQWSRAFNDRSKQKNWLDASRLSDIISEKIRQKNLSLPKQIYLAGFKTITPQTRELFNALESAGCTINFLSPPKIHSEAWRIEASSPQEELRLAAIWAREKLEKNPAARIGIVVPDLSSRRNQIQRVFDEILAPAKLLPSGLIESEVRQPFNISQGIALLQYPLITTAFNLLSLKQNILETSVWTALIRSPFVSGAEVEFDSRSLCNYALCDTHAMTATIATVQHLANHQSRPHYSPRFADMLGNLQNTFRELPKFTSARDWAKLFSALLETAGWPGERSLSSEEFQLVKSWRELLDQFISTDTIASKLDFQQAASTLRSLAAETQFQAESFNEPVQILGVYEALGQEFDHVWLLGFDDNAWPLRARANPFLPIAAQIAVGIPQASVEGALQFAQRATEHLLAAAPAVMVSYALTDKDQAMRPSALIQNIPLSRADKISAVPQATLYQTIQRSSRTEKLSGDYIAPELTESLVRGGTDLYKYQAACPFRAFAQVRLNAQPWPTPRVGLDASERGQIVHKAMEFLWLHLVTQAKLLTLNETEQIEKVQEAVNNALEDWQQKKQILPKRFKTLETRRLVGLIQDWLVLEKIRLPFSVMATEKKTPLSLAGLTIDLRRDRIDQLSDGMVAIMDYKTGNPTSLPWNDESGRPDEPQLPLYALASEQPVSALLFGKIKAGENAVIGIAESLVSTGTEANGFKITIPDEAPTLAQKIDIWRGELTQLAQHFRAGDAAVDPKKSVTCQHCHLSSLCRKNEILDVSFLHDEETEAEHDQ
ncbi:MAG: PD-(D/E)XK nuclease family protein [Burkholderiales bacterium]